MTEILRVAAYHGALAACAILAACATDVVVLLPEKDGNATAVTVKQGDKEVVLDQPYAAAKLAQSGPEPYHSSAHEVQSQFGVALAAQPARATSFTLYFVEGKDELTDESKKVVDQILSEIARHPVPDVLVVGHTDAVGNEQYNDALGQQRAEKVRSALMRLGIPAADIRAISRGGREPAVLPGTDARNRRVEIIVR